MSFQYLEKMPDVDSILQGLPLSEELKRVKQQRDALIKDVFIGRSQKFILIIGPCSADKEGAVCEYVNRLARLQEKVKDVMLLVPRIYTNKPRTTGQGYKGMGHQPDPQDKPDMVAGLKAIRALHIRSLAESGLTAADEMLYPGNYPYLEDVLSYVAIGARSVENQQHRLTVSGLEIPVGMKNPTSGDLSVMLNSVQAAQAPHVFVYNGWQVQTTGNPLAHCILRGAFNQYGRSIPNYHYEDMVRLMADYEARGITNPAVIVDTNHSNSDKNFREQPRIAWEIIRSMRQSEALKNAVKGLMIESYLVEGSQGVNGETAGQSITDPCLGWEESEHLVLELADGLTKL